VKPGRYARAKRLLLEVADLPEGDRKAYLDSACKDDPELRKEVDSLLAYDADRLEILGTGGATSPAPVDTLIGQTVAHFEILDQIGVGGMGVVYKAEDTSLRRTVALKFLPLELARDPGAKARFLREAQAAAALDHANICTVHEIGENEGLTFIAMAYVEGRSLKEMLGAGPVELDQAMDLSIQIAEGLKAAHDKGIVHRDIKPANVMVTSEGRAKIADFGLAKFAGRSEITTGGTRMGTVSYMSPEQARGEAVDHRTDIWSLGAMLYEMITGQRPFRGDHDSAVIYSILNEDPEPMTSVRVDVPQEVQWIVDRAMAKSPDERYQSVTDMLADLRLLRRGAGTQPRADQLIAAKRPPSIAVLPFVNMSGDAENEYFSDGLAEDLINSLSHIKELRVVARTSAFSFKGKDVPIREIGRKLGAGTLLEGSVRRSGNRLRVTAQLVNAGDGCHLWSERYDRQMEDVFAVQDEMSRAIVDKLRLKLLGEEERRLAKRHTEDQEAYHLYLKGRYVWNTRQERGMSKALEYFHRAIAKDPRYALPYVGIADAISLLSFWGFLPAKESFPKAKAAIEEALGLDDMLSEAHASRGWINTIYDWDWAGAEKELKQATELNPNHAMVHMWYAHHLVARRRFEEALRQARRAQELDPLSLTMGALRGIVLGVAGQCDAAIDLLSKTLEMDPDFALANLILAWACSWKGRLEEAIAAYKKALSLMGESPMVIGHLGGIYALTGQRAEALKMLDRLTELSKQRYVSAYNRFHILLFTGDTDKAFDCLDEACTERVAFLSMVASDPVLADIYAHPRFVAVLKRMGLEPSAY
jgi:serine/threonine protein kinase/tetratricopeptide (TPR) repeat protein